MGFRLRGMCEALSKLRMLFGEVPRIKIRCIGDIQVGRSILILRIACFFSTQGRAEREGETVVFVDRYLMRILERQCRYEGVHCKT